MNIKGVLPVNAKKVPAIDKGADWREYCGPVKTKMYGIAVRDGAVVIDLDVYKGVTREAVNSVLGCELPWDDAHIQDTVNGGQHYAFGVPLGLDIPNTIDTLETVGFDVRSAGKGYIATGEGYTDHSMLGVVQTLLEVDLLPPLPQAAIDALCYDNDDFFGDDSDNSLELALASTPLDLSDEDIRYFLGKLNEGHSSESSTWLMVGMGISHQFNNSEAGWAHFDKFSRLSMDNYDERENRKRWESFAKQQKIKPVTFASIIKLVGGYPAIAQERSDSLSERIASSQTIDELKAVVVDVANIRMDSINSAVINKVLAKQFGQITGEKFTVSQVSKIIKSARKNEGGDYIENYIFLTSTGEYMDRETKTVMGPRAFDVKHDRETPSKDGEPQRATQYVNNKIECVHGGMYAPTFDNIFQYDGVDYFNTYRPCDLVPVEGNSGVVEAVQNHIKHLLTDEREREILTSYLAHNVQFPGKKIHWAMILQGVEGDGKSFFAEMMKYMLGQTNCKSIGAEVLEEKFTAWAEGNCMVFIEEVKMDNYRKYEVLNKLKPYITNPTVSVRKMQTDVYEAINTTNYFALTNFKDALPIGDNDRRYCVIFSQWQSREKLAAWTTLNPSYYVDLYKIMRENTSEILHWLKSYKIPKWFLDAGVAPITRAKEMMVEMSKSDDFLIIEDAITKHQCFDINPEVVNVTKLVKLSTDMFEEAQDVRNFPKTSRLRNILIDMGYHNIGRYKDSQGKNALIYAKDDTKKAVDFKSKGDGEDDYFPF